MYCYLYEKKLTVTQTNFVDFNFHKAGSQVCWFWEAYKVDRRKWLCMCIVEHNEIISKNQKHSQSFKYLLYRLDFNFFWTKISDRIVRFFWAIQNYVWAGINKFRLILDIFIFSLSVYANRNFLKNLVRLWYFCSQFILIEIISNIFPSSSCHSWLYQLVSDLIQKGKKWFFEECCCFCWQ